MKPLRLVVVAAVAALALVGCDRGNGTATPPAPSSGSGTPTATPIPAGSATAVGQWSTQPVTVTHQVPVPPVPVLTGIRSAAHQTEGFDRITFDFRGPLPGYEVRYVDKVVGGATGLPVTVPGRRWIAVTFRPAQAHEDNGTPTVVPLAKTLDHPMLRAYAIVDDFEAVLTVALGLDDVVAFRVGELPGRVYVDVAA